MKQPEALRIADVCRSLSRIDDAYSSDTYREAADELRRLYQLAEEQHTEIYGLRLQVRNLTATGEQT